MLSRTQLDELGNSTNSTNRRSSSSCAPPTYKLLDSTTLLLLSTMLLLEVWWINYFYLFRLINNELNKLTSMHSAQPHSTQSTTPRYYYCYSPLCFLNNNIPILATRHTRHTDHWLAQPAASQPSSLAITQQRAMHHSHSPLTSSGGVLLVFLHFDLMKERMKRRRRGMMHLLS